MLQRILALACLAGLFSPAPAVAQLKATPYVSGLTLPVAFIQDRADPTIQYVVQQGGRISLVRNGVLQSTDFLNLTTSISSGGERGLLGMALAPDWATSGRFFVNFTNAAGHTVVARFRRSTANPLVADVSTRFDLVWSTGQAFITQPYANHNGGTIGFGPDGYLYIGMGDGGSGNDPENRAQDPNELLGKMLRIDVNVADGHPTGFTIPAGNPFRNSSRPEIWDFGVRNPWKWSFDDPSRGGNGALIIADVGQNAFEEIDYEAAGQGGRNYGWRIREGTHATAGVPPTTPAFTPLVNPIYDYTHTVGASITGGYVYRGSALGSGYAGRYFFGDFVSGRIWSIALTVDPATGMAAASDLREHTTELSSSSVSSFGVDAGGELYFINYGSGSISRIDSAGPTITLDRSFMGFGALLGNQAFARQTPAQALRLSQAGAGPVTWTVSSSAPWLVVSPTSGSGPANLTLSVQFAAGLTTGSNFANLTFSFTGAGAAPSTLPVRLDVFNGSSLPPFGLFDTPASGATNLAGSVAVTGWSIDDIDVSRVRIWRDPVGNEPPGALVFIGDATLVEGARPDVQAAYAGFAQASRAGWGYLLLTNFLPDLGNGTFTLYATAEDAEGHVTTLGTKTITCNNSGSTAPFGAIDTPAQGGIVTGTVTNFGWVLSPGPRRADPPGGGSVQVVIDGVVAAVVPSGWASRPDLTALFPASQYPGVVAAVGNAVFDSTTLTNGVHTIAWVVTDNLGAPAGIGSRYFTVSNGSSSVLGAQCCVLSAQCCGLSAQCPVPGAQCSVQSALSTQGAALRTEHPARSTQHGALSTVVGRRGFDPFAAYETFEVDADGRITIDIPEMDRVELWVGAGAEGHAIVAGARQPLPIGSQLDPESGRFTWSPGVGFLGAYDLVLGGRQVRIRIGAKK